MARPQQIRDLSVILPLLATVLLMPPAILLFAKPAVIAGIPLVVLYIFGTWGTVIVAAYLLSRQASRSSD